MPSLCMFSDCNEARNDDIGRGVVCAKHAVMFKELLSKKRCGSCGDGLMELERYLCTACWKTLAIADAAEKAKEATN